MLGKGIQCDGTRMGGGVGVMLSLLLSNKLSSFLCLCLVLPYRSGLGGVG